MATPMEQAVVELQILVRQLRQRLLGLERRLGVEEDPSLRPAQAVPGYVPLKSKEQGGAVSHAAGGWVEPYDIAPSRKENAGPGNAGGMAVAMESPGSGAEGDEAGGHGAGEIPETEIPETVSVPMGSVPTGTVPPVSAARAHVAPGDAQPAEAAAAPVAAESVEPVVAAGPAPYETVPAVEKDRSQPLYAWDTAYLYRPADERAARQAEARAALEKTIGEKVASSVGALVLIAGMLFLIKCAWDVSWQTPLVRVMLTLVDGLAVVGMGAWLHGRQARPLSGAIAAIGIAVMMAGIIAGNGAAVGFGPALIAIAAVGLFGMLVAWQMGLETMAVLAFLGMYLAPAILQGGGDGSAALLAYLLIVTACAVALPAVLRQWYAVRMAAFFCAWLWMLQWVQRPDALAHPTLGAGATAAFFAVFLLELAADLPRFGRVSPRHRALLTALFEGQPNTLEGVIAIFSCLNTLAAMTAFGMLFLRTERPGVALVALGLAGVMTVFAAIARSRIVSAAAMVQAVGLIVLAVPFYFESAAVGAAWAIVALALGIAARWRNSAIARVWMVVVVGLLAGHILFVDSANLVLPRTLFTFDPTPAAAGMPSFWQTANGWMLMAWSAAGLTLVLGWLARERTIKADDGGLTVRGAAWATVSCLIAGTTLVAFSAVWCFEPHAPATLAVLVWVMAVICFCRLRSVQESEANVETLLAVALMVITVKWAVFDGFARTGSGYAGVLAGAPFFNLFFLTAILLAGAIMVSRSAREVGRAFAGWWITAVGFIALNVETLRAVDCFVGMGGAGPVYGVDPWIVKCVALSIVWGMVGLVLVLVGLLKNAAPIRWVGLILLGVTVAKVLLVDTASAQMMLRVLSFMVVGAVLLLVSFAYHKVSVLPRGEPVTGAAGAGVPK